MTRQFTSVVQASDDCDTLEALRLRRLALAALDQNQAAIVVLEQYSELILRNRCRPSFNQIIFEEAAAAEVFLVDYGLMRNRAHRIAIRIAFCLAAIIVVLLLAELSFRLLPQGDGFPQRVNRFSETMLVADPTLSHRMLPTQTVTIGGIVYQTNSLGLRGSEPDPSSSYPLVLILGDSVTMGWGVREEEAFPARIAAILGDQGTNVSVINAGVLAYGVQQYALFLTELLEQLDPEFVIIGYFPNDPEPPENSFRRSSLSWSRLWRRLSVPINTILIRIGVRPTAVDYYRALHLPGSQNWVAVIDSFREIAQVCMVADVSCGVVLIPALIGDPYPLLDLHTRVEASTTELGLPTLDLAIENPRGDPRLYWVATDDSHPNAEIHSRYGLAIASWVRDFL